MTPLHADIIRTIKQHGPITSEDIAERLTELGYGGGTCFDEFKRNVSKIASKMKVSGKIIGDDIPLPGARPIRVYRMVEAQEMASDVAKVDPVNGGYLEDIHGPIATNKESLTVAYADMVATLDSLDTEREIQERKAVAETVTPEPVSVDVKVEHKPHLAIADIMDAYHQEVAEDTDQNFYSFCLGIAYAEKHHGISQ